MRNISARNATSTTSPGELDGASVYTCPMHPQIREPAPGNCPICGMTLEPVKASATPGENPELVDMSRRFWVGLVLTLPVFILEMGGAYSRTWAASSGAAAHLHLDSICPVHTGCPVGGMALL